MSVSLVPGIASVIEQAVLSVFNDLNISSSAWIERSKLLTVGRRRYGEYVAQHIATFSLFGVSRTASVDSSYVRVSVTTEIEREIYKPRTELSKYLREERSESHSQREVVSSKTPFEALQSSKQHFALLGTAGSGKTTVFKHLSLQLAQGIPLREKRRIPVYLAVRDLALSNKTIHSAAIDFLHDLEVTNSERVLVNLLKSGRVVLLLDGLDETDPNHQAKLIAELSAITKRYPMVILCLSGRPYSLSISLPPGFDKWEMLPLSFKSRLEFVSQWFAAVDPEKGARLIQECRGRREFLDLGSNPLLLSIVCALYYNDLHIPSDPDELYERSLEGLLGRWDAFRNIARGTVLGPISISRRILLLSWLAADLFEHGLIVFSERDVESRDILARCFHSIRVRPIAVADLLSTLFDDFGIIVERSPGLYTFSHLTFQEYLTARYIRDYRRELPLLVQHHISKEWFEVIRLVAKLLPDAAKYMIDLTNKTNFTEQYQVSLLRAAWEANPICPPGIASKLVGYAGDKITDALNLCKHTVELEGSKLILGIGGAEFWPYRDTIGDLLAIIACSRVPVDVQGKRFHRIVKAILQGGVDIKEVEVRELMAGEPDQRIRTITLPSPKERAETELRKLFRSE